MKKFLFLFTIIFSLLFILLSFNTFSEDSIQEGAIPKLVQPEMGFLANSSQEKEIPAFKTASESLDRREQLLSMIVITKEDIRNCIGCGLTDILEQFSVQIRHFHDSFPQSSDTDTAHADLFNFHSFYDVSTNMRLGMATKNIIDEKYGMYFHSEDLRQALWLIFKNQF